MSIWPPPMAEILGLAREPQDRGYDWAGRLDGIKGAWHRLWSALITVAMEPTADTAEMARIARNAFEGQLGRQMTAEEFAILNAQASIVAEALLRPATDFRI